MAKAGRILGGSVKLIFYLVIIVINAIILWRVLFSGDLGEIKPLVSNEITAKAYSEHGKDLIIERQKQRTISSSGKFSVTDCVFIPQAEQIQITVRYNNSTLEKLAADYELDKAPDRKNELFDITIVKTRDLTPDDTEDNTDKSALSEERYFPSGEPKTAYKTLYTYKKFIFDNVTYEDAVGMFVDIYYLEDTDYESKPYDALCIYDSLLPVERGKLTSSDIKAIKKFEKAD